MSKSFSKTLNFCFNSDDLNDNYELTTELFSKIVNKHAPPKKKFLCGNQVPFNTNYVRLCMIEVD